MRAVLVLNGEPPSLSRLRQLAESHPVYAADGGAAVCLAAGVRPEWVAGDFDSHAQATLPADWTVLEFPEQDRTDFQKLLASLPPEIDNLLVLGGLGRRLDHLISNLLIATEIAAHKSVCFFCDNQKLQRVTPACAFRETLPVGSTLSLLPLSEVGGVCTRGLKWNLQHADMGAGIQLGQSNQVTGAVEIRVGQGTLFVWTEPDLCSK